MIIKKFTGKTEEEALTAAKKELGNSIVIMNVKSVKPKGLFGAFRAKQTEVTVAMEEEHEVLSRMGKSAGGQSILQVKSVASTGQESSSENIEKKLDSLQTLLESKLKSEEERNGKEAEKEPEKEKEPAEERNDNDQEPVIGEQEKFIRLLYNTMIDNEVDEKYANQLLGEIDKCTKPDQPFDYILANIYQRMVLKFGKPEGITPSQRGPKVVLFIGPTGVGKTTTIAKLASCYAVEEKKKVALLTADTYRIAAAEQLRTYADILEVPFRVIYTKEEFAASIDNFKGYDYIFVDTAGHSHQNEQQLGDMKNLIASIDENTDFQCFLVLSATTKYKDLLKIAKNYKNITSYQLIFTKLDETTELGNLLNLRMATDTTIAYVTCGQNVPSDIEVFNPQKTVKQLLGGKY